MSIEIKSPAKINLYLKIGNKEESTGMHFIESIMVPINLFDTMIIEESRDFSVITKGIKETIPTEKNIICKIFKALIDYTGKKIPNFHIALLKSIPTGAGLGGGSSNGAYFLSFINSYLDLNLTKEQLVEIATIVGSDIPFFLYNSPALVSGKGEKIELLEIKKIEKHLLLIYPDIIVNTGLAYTLFDKKKLTKSASVNINSVRKSGICSLEDWTKVIFNDFEDVVFEQWPFLSKLKRSIEASGADRVFMSGSGSALISIFSSELTRDNAFDEFEKKFGTVRKIELLTG